MGTTPQSIPGSAASISPTSLKFSSQYVGTSGNPRSVTLTNTGTAALTIASVTTSPSDFASLNACGSSLAAGSSCAIGVFFDPTVGGARTGTLTITNNAAGSPQTVTLTGSGEDFSVNPGSAATATVGAGQTANYPIAVAPAGGFAQERDAKLQWGTGGVHVRGVAEYDCAERGCCADGHGEGYNCDAWMGAAVRKWLAPGYEIPADADDFDIGGYVPDGHSVAIWAARTEPRMGSSGCVCSAGHSGIYAHLLWWRFGEQRWRDKSAGRNLHHQCHGQFHYRLDYPDARREIDSSRAVSDLHALVQVTGSQSLATGGCINSVRPSDRRFGKPHPNAGKRLHDVRELLLRDFLRRENRATAPPDLTAITRYRLVCRRRGGSKFGIMGNPSPTEMGQPIATVNVRRERPC